jgi:anaphase-promoting complex subunit 3
MLPPDADVAAQLRHQIFYMLDNNYLDNALFAAGRLHALDPRGADAAHIFALCHLRLGRLKAAFDYARDKGARGQHLGCAYVFAQACLGLEKYHEGLSALDRARHTWMGKNNWSESSQRFSSGLEWSLQGFPWSNWTFKPQAMMPVSSCVGENIS